MNKLILRLELVFLILSSTLIIVSCAREITQEEAMVITKNYVDNRGLFYINLPNGTKTVQTASITIFKTEKVNGDWDVFLNVQSNQTGELKQKDIIVTVDAKKGEIKGMR